MAYRRRVKEIIILMALSVILALIVNYFSPVGIAIVGQWDTSKGTISANANNNAGIKLEEIDNVRHAKKIYDEGKALFVDARSLENYEDGHIPGAVSLPVGHFDDRFVEFINQYSPDRPIVTYCSGRTCEDSHQLAQLLQETGFTNIKIFIDGFPGWEAEGYPIE
jgi:rhodanese-related sulfurtransferase